jgi:hypothetical protein
VGYPPFAANGDALDKAQEGMRASQTTDRRVAWDEADGKGRQACAHESRNHRLAFSETAKAGATKERGPRHTSRCDVPGQGPPSGQYMGAEVPGKTLTGATIAPQASQSRVPFGAARFST